jgi:hypothetical protein
MRRIIELPAIGTRRTTAFVSRADGCGGLQIVDLPVHPVTLDHERFAEARRAAGLSIRDAALKLGIRAVHVSGLEHGRCAPEDGDWDALICDLLGTGG